MNILVINSGSSSYKCALFQTDSVGQLLGEPQWQLLLALEEHGVITSSTKVNGGHHEETISADSLEEAFAPALESLWSGSYALLSDAAQIGCVGHRVVHGGRFKNSRLIDGEVLEEIRYACRLAPQHNPAALRAIETTEKMLPGAIQVAVFDTAFHGTLPDYAAAYPGPYEWWQRGLRRYGFHGISHGDCAGRAADILARHDDSFRLVSCHLGNGCSLAAIRGGQSIDTTMGFTPLEGLMMGTRSGSIDPGLITHLIREGESPAELDRTLNKESGLKGISGFSSDMRDVIQEAEAGNECAKLALNMFVHRLNSGIGAMIAALGGIDALSFTGGIGENSPYIRAAVCSVFSFLGIELDENKNANSSAETKISTAVSRIDVLVLPARENWVLARECLNLCREESHS